MSWKSWAFPLLILAAAFTSGCQFNRRCSLVRVWCDHNTLRAPALYVEEIRNPVDRPARFSRSNWIDNRRTRPPWDFQDLRFGASLSTDSGQSGVVTPSQSLPSGREDDLPPLPADPSPDADTDKLLPVPAPIDTPHFPEAPAKPYAPPPEKFPGPTALQNRGADLIGYISEGSAVEVTPQKSQPEANPVRRRTEAKRPVGAWLFSRK